MEPDVNKPVENPRLTALFAGLSKAEGAERNKLAEEIAKEIALNAWLLAVVQMNPVPEGHNGQGGKIQLKKGTTISFPLLTTADGKKYLPVFTDWNELRKWPQYANQQVRTMILSFDDIAATAAGKFGAAVNLFSDDFRISMENIARMKQTKDIQTKGATSINVPKGTTVRLGEPADYPAEMVEAIRKYAAGVRSINAIWLRLMVRNDEASYLLVVDSREAGEKLWKGIADAAMPYRKKELFIDFISLDDSFGREAAKGEPIYRRRRGLFG